MSPTDIQTPKKRPGPTRRSFLKWSAVTGGAAALVSTVSDLGMPGDSAHALPVEGMADADRTVWSACVVNCGSRCPLRLQVKDGVVERVLPDNTGDNSLLNRQIRACVRGRNMRERIYNPDRLKTPLKRREGTPRGGGQWDEISWEEAFDLFAEKLQYTIDTYGNEAIFKVYGSGVWNAHLGNSGGWQRLFNLMGGSLNYYGNYSYSQIGTITRFHYGAPDEQISNSFEDTVVNGRMLVLWGNNPQETRMSGGGLVFTSLEAAKTEGLRIVVIDPRYSDSAALLADQWIAPRPGTDAALVAGIVHHLIANDLHDQDFLDTYCVGFDEEHMPEGIPGGNSYRSYIEGTGPDGVAKTPEWASAITGVPADVIREFALELGRTKPVNITQGWGPQRHANGEYQARAIYTLSNVLGQVGIPGGGTGGREGYYWPLTTWFPDGENPVKTAISNFGWTDAIERGPELTATKDGVRGADRLKVGIKFMLEYGGNMLASQHADNHRTREILTDESNCEFICVVDNQFTGSVALADLVLPDTTTAERWDFAPSEYTGDMAYLIMCEKAIDPLFNSRPAYEMCTEIAKRLGIEEEFTEGRTLEDWARHLHETEYRPAVEGLPSFDEMKDVGVFRYHNPEGLTVPLRQFRDDPEANPLATPSGKIEIFSNELWQLAKDWEFPDAALGDRISALPEHVTTWEGPEEAIAPDAKYPIQLIGHHYKQRTHSTYGNHSKLKEAHPQTVWINTLDADRRGIADGDLVEIFNDRGRVKIPAKVTPKTMPGVASLPQGAWMELDDEGVDRGGSVNVLTKIHPTPIAKGNAQHTNLVQIKKVKGGR
ncbi:DMSO/selenate family reductase complex A subunit [Georgenia sp. Marseille-Q6866]